MNFIHSRRLQRARSVWLTSFGLLAAISVVSCSSSPPPTSAPAAPAKTPLPVNPSDQPEGKSVSARSLMLRDGTAGALPGPSEFELRQIFNRAVEMALERSPEMRQSQSQQLAAEADTDEAKGQRWPQLQLGTESRALQFGKGSGNTPSRGGVNMNLTTPVFDWGRIGHTIDSREQLSEAAKERLEAQRETVGFEVVSTLVELGKQRVAVDISQQFVNRMDDLVKMLAGIVAVDSGRRSELTQAKTRLLQAQALRDAAEAKVREAQINLLKLVGENPVPIPQGKEWNIGQANLDELLESAKSHPTILQAVAETESAESQAKAVRASGLPRLNWVVGKTTAEDGLGREQPWQTSLSVSWNAFSGGSTRAAERAALQRAEASRYNAEQQQRDLEFRIRAADNDAKTQLARANLYRDLKAESDAVRKDFYDQWYHLSKRTLLDVLIAENDHYGNQISEITNRFDSYNAIFREYAGAGVLTRWLRDGR